MSVNRASEVWKEIKPFAIRDMNSMLDAKSGDGSDDLYAIILYDESAQKIKYYSMSLEGLQAALLAASSGDVVFVPAGTITLTGSNDYVAGDEISTGSIPVSNVNGTTISGLTIGALYCVEAYGGPGYYTAGLNKRYQFSLSINGGSLWEGILGWGETVSGGYPPQLTMPSWGLFAEYYDSPPLHARIFFVAAGESIKIRFSDASAEYSDNTGTLNWRLRAATGPDFSISSGVEVVGLGKNSILDGSLFNEGILTNIRVTGTISGDGDVRMVPNPANEVFNNEIDMQVNRIINLENPIDDQDAATKNYVDSIAVVSQGYFSVKSYGAVGDGISDDTISVQNALDAAAVSGGVAWFPGGTYLCDPLTCYSNVTIRGVGRDVSIIKSKSSGTLLDYGIPTGIVSQKPILDITLEGNSVGTNGVGLVGGASFVMERVSVYRFTGKGLYFRAVLVSNINECEIRACGTGISNEDYTLAVSGTVKANLVRLNNTVVSENSVWAIDWKEGALLVLNSVDIEANGVTGNANTGGVKFAPEHEGIGVVIQNSWFEYNNGKADVVIETPTTVGQYCSISDSIFIKDTGTSYGIYVEGAVRENNVLCRNVQFDDEPAVVNFYANGDYSNILLDNCTGSTGGDGTITVVSQHSPVTVTDSTTIDLTLTGQDISADLKNTSVTPGNFTNANISVDAQGRLTAASNGSGAGKYRQFLYYVDTGDFVFLTDNDGNPLLGLLDLE